jgi:hypothetical protein
VVALVERVVGDHPGGVGDRLGRGARREPPHRGLAQPGLDRRGDPVPRHPEPRLELRVRVEVQPFEKLARDAEQRGWVVGRRDAMHIDNQLTVDAKLDRVARERKLERSA